MATTTPANASAAYKKQIADIAQDFSAVDFTPADFPGAAFHLDNRSPVTDGGLLIEDLVVPARYQTSDNDTYDLIANTRAWQHTGVGISDTAATSVSGTPVALGTKHMLAFLVCNQMASSQDSVELGNSVASEALWITNRDGVGDGSYVTLSGSEYLNTTEFSTPTGTLGSPCAVAVAFNRSAASEAESLKAYRLQSNGVQEVTTATKTGSSQNFLTYDFAALPTSNTLDFNKDAKRFNFTIFYLTDNSPLSSDFIWKALQWMIANPGYVYPGLHGAT